MILGRDEHVNRWGYIFLETAVLSLEKGRHSRFLFCFSSNRAKEQAFTYFLEYTVKGTIRRRDYMKHSVTKAQAQRWVGKNIIATKKDGTLITGKLLRISGNRLIMQRNSGKKVQTKAIIP